MDGEDVAMGERAVFMSRSFPLGPVSTLTKAPLRSAATHSRASTVEDGRTRRDDPALQTLLADSPARDRGSNPLSLEYDQRGPRFSTR